jgi:hypothetical protein
MRHILLTCEVHLLYRLLIFGHPIILFAFMNQNQSKKVTIELQSEHSLIATPNTAVWKQRVDLEQAELSAENVITLVAVKEIVRNGFHKKSTGLRCSHDASRLKKILNLAAYVNIWKRDWPRAMCLPPHTMTATHHVAGATTSNFCETLKEKILTLTVESSAARNVSLACCAPGIL